MMIDSGLGLLISFDFGSPFQFPTVSIKPYCIHLHHSNTNKLPHPPTMTYNMVTKKTRQEKRMILQLFFTLGFPGVTSTVCISLLQVLPCAYRAPEQRFFNVFHDFIRTLSTSLINGDGLLPWIVFLTADELF